MRAGPPPSHSAAGARLAFGWEGLELLQGLAGSAQGEARAGPRRLDSRPRHPRLGPSFCARATSFGLQALPGTGLPLPWGALRPGPGAVSCARVISDTRERLSLERGGAAVLGWRVSYKTLHPTLGSGESRSPRASGVSLGHPCSARSSSAAHTGPPVEGRRGSRHSPCPRISPRGRRVRFALGWVPGPAPSRGGRVGGGRRGPGPARDSRVCNPCSFWLSRLVCNPPTGRCLPRRPARPPGCTSVRVCVRCVCGL